MAADRARLEATSAWLAHVRADLRAAELDLGADPPLAEDAAFHAQQAADKTMKALLTWHGKPFRATHDLAEIGLQCVELDPSLEPLFRRAAPLSVFAWAFRYPGTGATLQTPEAQDALSTAREVYEAVLARLPEALRP